LQDFRSLAALHEAVRPCAIKGESIQNSRSIARWIKVTEEIGEPTFAGERHDARPLALAHAADIAEHRQVDTLSHRFCLDRIGKLSAGAARPGLARTAL